MVPPISTEALPTPAQRPVNSTLDCSIAELELELDLELGLALPAWREHLHEFLLKCPLYKKLVSVVLGTRTENIKLAPLIRGFQQAEDFRTRVVLTGQNLEMVSQVMGLFGLMADHDLALMAHKQTHTHT